MSLDVLKKDIASFPEAGRGRWQSFRLTGTASRDPKIYPFNIYLFFISGSKLFHTSSTSSTENQKSFYSATKCKWSPFLKCFTKLAPIELLWLNFSLRQPEDQEFTPGCNVLEPLPIGPFNATKEQFSILETVKSLYAPSCRLKLKIAFWCRDFSYTPL